MMYKAWRSIEKATSCFTRSSVKFQGHTGQKLSILTKLVFTDGYEMMRKAWCSIEV